jgi:ABC-type antimicrobial peptide transport system permease subunit
MDELLKQATWAFKLFGVQFTVFGVLALFLAAVGLYGVMAFSVNQRKREMGVRMALGAEGFSILQLVLSRAALQVAVGVAAGLVMGALMSGPLHHVLFGVETSDVRVYLAIAVTLAVAGLLACIPPALAATRADPLEAMRVN